MEGIRIGGAIALRRGGHDVGRDVMLIVLEMKAERGERGSWIVVTKREGNWDAGLNSS